MSDLVRLAIALVGLLVLVQPAPPRLASAGLQRFGRRVGIQFHDLARGAAAPAPVGDERLSGLVWQLARAIGCFIAGTTLGTLLLGHGPALSQSTVQSVTVAGLMIGAVVGPLLLLRPFLQPLKGVRGGVGRTATIEDYLSPVSRVLRWMAVLAALAVPVGAISLASSPFYDGSKIYWEGLIGLPLASVLVLLAGERTCGWRDDVTYPAPTYFWDALRTRTLRLLTLFGAVGVAFSWAMASEGLAGVAFVPGPDEGWVLPARAGAKALYYVFLLVAGVHVLPSVRFRQRLWPGLSRGQLVPLDVGTFSGPGPGSHR